MTGAEHYLAAEQLLEHAAAMLDVAVGPEHEHELVQRQIAVATCAQAHALLAAAAVAGLTADLSVADSLAWRKAAASQLED
jgi:hypothetical protein